MSDSLSATPTRVAVDETAVEINDSWSCIYDTILTETKTLLGIEVFDRHGTDSETAFQSELAEKHDFTGATLLVDGYEYRAALFQVKLSGQFDYTERNPVEWRFHTLK